ncbi:hypothetical protein OpiT1DRAFT_03850 [Opitutaceae bacterium TAV1]|nr:hypothetical protein OpiT1DRAFT_03850 [Opitutaceae bacterium TAV1]
MSNENPTTPARAVYDIDGNGQILRDGVNVGYYTPATKVVTVNADAAKYRPAIMRWLASEKIEVASSVIAESTSPLAVVGTTANPAIEPGIPTPPASAPVQQPASPPANIAPAASAAGARPPSMDRKFAPYKHPKYPDGPDLDPRFGARTPAFVTWLAQKQGK